MTFYAALIQTRSFSRSCSHLHRSIAEALDCALQHRRAAGAAAATVVAADMGADGVPRRRAFSPAEPADLESLGGGA
jgi:IS5 family transposase